MSKSSGKARRDSADRSVHLSIGSILWLPSKADIDGSLLVESSIDEGVFNHPFLVLSFDSRKNMAVGFIVSCPLTGKSCSSSADTES